MLVLFDNQILMNERDGPRPGETAAIMLMLAPAPITSAANTACEGGGKSGLTKPGPIELASETTSPNRSMEIRADEARPH
jgi:hypothetical protein